MSSVDLVQWLRDQLDEDAAVAQAAVSAHEQEPRLVACNVGGQWSHRYGDYGATEVVDGAGHVVVPAAHDKGAAVRVHVARHDPARVLREIEAARELLSRYEAMAADVLVMTGVESILAEYRRVILPNLAQRYADRPGYSEACRL